VREAWRGEDLAGEAWAGGVAIAPLLELLLKLLSPPIARDSAISLDEFMENRN
jgi:hypothetical protein